MSQSLNIFEKKKYNLRSRTLNNNVNMAGAGMRLDVGRGIDLGMRLGIGLRLRPHVGMGPEIGAGDESEDRTGDAAGKRQLGLGLMLG